MSRILFAWELGANLGHLTRDLPVAERLRAAGHEVVFAVKDTRVAAELLVARRMPFLQAPLCAGKSKLSRPPINYAELLEAEGWRDRRGLYGHLSAWRELIVRGGFDAIVVDHAPGALVASHVANRLAIPLGNGFEIPPDTEPMPGIRPWEPVAPEALLRTERAVLADVNAAVSALGGRPYRRLGQIFPRHSIFATFAELDHYGARVDADYVGSIHGLNQAARIDWPVGTGPRILVYLRLHHRPTAIVLDHLAGIGARAVCVVPEAGRRFKERFERDSIKIVERPVALQPLLGEADAMIGYAGIGSMSEALLKGVRLLMIPTTVEQYLCAKRVEAIGAGIALGGKPDERKVHDALGALLGESDHGRNATVFAQRYVAMTPERAAERAAEAMLGLIRDGDGKRCQASAQRAA